MSLKNQCGVLGIAGVAYACALWFLEWRLLGFGYEPLDYDRFDQLHVVLVLFVISFGPPSVATLVTNAALTPFWRRVIVLLGHAIAVILSIFVCFREQSAMPSILGVNLFTYQQWSRYFAETKFLGQTLWLIAAQLALCLVMYAIRSRSAPRHDDGA